jgi:hypothetical protein
VGALCAAHGLRGSENARCQHPHSPASGRRHRPAASDTAQLRARCPERQIREDVAAGLLPLRRTAGAEYAVGRASADRERERPDGGPNALATEPEARVLVSSTRAASSAVGGTPPFRAKRKSRSSSLVVPDRGLVPMHGVATVERRGAPASVRRSGVPRQRSCVRLASQANVDGLAQDGVVGVSPTRLANRRTPAALMVLDR